MGSTNSLASMGGSEGLPSQLPSVDDIPSLAHTSESALPNNKLRHQRNPSLGDMLEAEAAHAERHSPYPVMGPEGRPE